MTDTSEMSGMPKVRSWSSVYLESLSRSLVSGCDESHTKQQYVGHLAGPHAGTSPISVLSSQGKPKDREEVSSRRAGLGQLEGLQRGPHWRLPVAVGSWGRSSSPLSWFRRGSRKRRSGWMHSRTVPGATGVCTTETSVGYGPATAPDASSKALDASLRSRRRVSGGGLAHQGRTPSTSGSGLACVFQGSEQRERPEPYGQTVLGNGRGMRVMTGLPGKRDAMDTLLNCSRRCQL